MQDSFVQILVCAFCQEPLGDVVKTLPECGNSICGECYHVLMDSLDQKSNSRRSGTDYTCFACEKQHKMPRQGLPNNVVLGMLTQQRPEVEKSNRLRNVIEKLQQKIVSLRSTGDEETMNAHCDKLLTEVSDAAEAAIKHLNETRDGLFQRINEYRDELLRQRNNGTPPAKRIRTSNAPCTSRQAIDDPDPVEPDEGLDELASEVYELGKKWAGHFSRAAKGTNVQEIDSALARGDGLEAKIQELTSKHKNDFLSRRLMVYKANDLFVRSSEHLGQLVFDATPPKPTAPETTRREPSTQEGGRAAAVLVHELLGHTDRVNQVLFLPNGNLVSCSDDSQIKVWDLETGQSLFSLTEHIDGVNSLAVLANGWLATASDDFTVKLWDLEARKLVQTLEGHKGAVFSLQPLSNGNLASCAFDDRIIIWDLVSVVLWMAGHGIKNVKVKMGLLSSGLLATCSDQKTSTIRLWNPETGVKIVSVSTEIESARSLLVLSDDKVAIGFVSGVIKIFDPNGRSESTQLPQCHRGEVTALAQAPNGLLLTSGILEEPNIKFWDLDKQQILQSINSDHVAGIHALAASRDDKTVASGSGDSTIRIWSLN